VTGVRLEPLRDEDSDALFRWINDHDLVVRSAPWRPIARADHDAWFAAIRRRDDVRIFAIREASADRLIGSCQLHSIDRTDRSAELQIRIGEAEARGRGHGREAVRLLLHEAFGPLGLRRVTLHVFASNAPALAVYRAAGFRELGDPPDEVEIDGRRERVLRMAIEAPGTARVVAIHQPNFFPWLGYFDKLNRCDVFVLLDSVQFSKGSRSNRTQVLVGDEPRWITAPIVRAGANGPIRDVLTDDQRDWRSKLVKTLRTSYARADAFAEAMPLLEELIANPEPRLAAYNEHAIRRLAEAIGASGAEIVRSSDLAVEGGATALLIDIVRSLGGTTYLAGDGAGGYQEDELFAANGIELVRQGYEPPEAAGGLSVIHALLSGVVPAGRR
jgi:RimJ/RimL family protein N-acetyltransferase